MRWLLLFAVLIVVAVVLSRRGHGRGQPAGRSSPPRPWHAVEIVAAGSAEKCAAVGQITGKRYLAREAPLLPLADCNIARCRCHYVHHEDRRSEPRRRRDAGLPDAVPLIAAERRRASDRREL